MNAKTLDELNEMAMRWVDGKINHLEVVSLKIFDRLLVLELANIYSMRKVGLLSDKYCAAYKLKFLNEHRDLKLKAEHMLNCADVQRQAVRRANELICKICKSYSSGEEIDLANLCEMQAEVIDLLTNDNVHLFLLHRALEHKMPKQSARAALIRHGSGIADKWGGQVPYEQILMSFFDTYLKDSGKEMWEQLTGDDYPTKARQSIPVADGEGKGIATSMKEHYDITYRDL